MKLIIECTEQTYSECKKISGLSETAFVIANGTPYNPSGDAISREALKGVIETYRPALIYNNKTDMKNRMVDYFLDEIDNAEAIPLPSEQIAWEQGYEAGLAQGKHDRPKGEWIFKNGKYRCTACGETAIYRYSGSLAITQTELLTQFCPKCGADMRAKENKNG